MSAYFSIKELAGVALPTGHREGVFGVPSMIDSLEV
jgi:hypothetical protein